jgi:hypothetical protein
MSSVTYAAMGAAAVIALIVLWRAAAVSFHRRRRTRKNQAFARRWRRSYADYQAEHARALADLSRDWNVIEIVHDLADYPLGLAGPPEQIYYEEAFDVVRRIRSSDGDLAIVLHTLGGSSMATEMISMALRSHKGRKVAFVPYAAMSGGTMIALATGEVRMGDTAVLGPIDTQFGPWPASAFKHLRESKSADHIRDEVLMASHLMETIHKDEVARVERLVDPAHAPGVASALIVAGRPHGETITREEASNIGVKISGEPFPARVYDLVDARLQMTAKLREDVFRRSLGVEG